MTNLAKERLNPSNDWKIPIYDSIKSEKIVAYANEGHGMSDDWWDEIYELHKYNLLWAIYKTSSGLRKIIN